VFVLFHFPGNTFPPVIVVDVKPLYTLFARSNDRLRSIGIRTL